MVVVFLLFCPNIMQDLDWTAEIRRSMDTSGKAVDERI